MDLNWSRPARREQRERPSETQASDVRARVREDKARKIRRRIQSSGQTKISHRALSYSALVSKVDNITIRASLSTRVGYYQSKIGAISTTVGYNQRDIETIERAIISEAQPKDMPLLREAVKFHSDYIESDV